MKPKLLKLLLDLGVSANAPQTGGIKGSPLYFAANPLHPDNINDNIKMVKMLYKKGGDPKALNKDGIEIINSKTTKQMTEFLIHLDRRFLPPPPPKPPIVLTPEQLKAEQDRRWKMKQKIEEEKRKQRARQIENEFWGKPYVFIPALILIIYLLFSTSNHW